TNTIKDAYFGITDQNRINQYHTARLRAQKRADSITRAVETAIQQQLDSNHERFLTADKVVGTYKDPWFGKVIIKQKDGDLRFKALKSPDLTGTMQYYKGTTYVVR